jgi:arylsulfatase A-like enzyme
MTKTAQGSTKPRRTAARVANVALLGAALALSAAACSRPKPAPTQSVVLVSLDTVRADHLGSYGYPIATSPHFDRLARRGALFARCQAQATATLPSHLALFRSCVASRAGHEAPMLAEHFRAAGWATAAFTGGGNAAGSLGFDRGFDHWEEDRRGLSWANPSFNAWLDARPGAKFFAFLHTYEAHAPYDPPAPYSTLFDPSYRGEVTGPDTRRISREIRGLDPPAASGPVVLNEADRRHIVALYDGAIRRGDDLLGDLVRSIEARGLEDGVTFAVFSDHGEEFWDHGSLLHSHTVFQELAHVPLVISGSGSRANLVPSVVRLMDVAPTLLETAGAPPALEHAGTSLVRWLRSGPAAPAENLPAVTEMGPWKALLEEPWKIVLGPAEGGALLFDLASDPGETRNVAGQADSVLAAMTERLAALVTADRVEELSREPMSAEQRERLQALGYVQ